MIKILSSGMACESPLVIATSETIERAEAPTLPTAPRSAVVAASMDRAERLEGLASHLEMLWRFVRRMGFAESAAEDVAQEAFVIAASRLDAIFPGKERSYLCLLYTSPSPRDRTRSRMPSSA